MSIEDEILRAVAAAGVRARVSSMITEEVNGADFIQQLDLLNVSPDERAALITEYQRVAACDEYYHPVTRLFLVGRHMSDLPDNYQVVGQDNVTFAGDVSETKNQIARLWQRAVLLGADALVFQNTPGIVSIALVKMFSTVSEPHRNPFKPLRVGVIISKQPNQRPAAVEKEFHFLINSEPGLGGKPVNTNLVAAQAAIKFVNPRALVSERDGRYLVVKVDPFIPFVFDKIEWF